jgi:hypothetical protein
MGGGLGATSLARKRETNMSKTRVFVSSTCYDLSQIREDLHRCIIELGHEPYLSEYPSFPVIPNLSTIENCKRNVRENTDIFILIIGGRYGSLVENSSKSITNSEYDCAKQYGIDSFIFVNDQVDSILPLWEKNPNADFSSYVDSSEVFRFIKGIRNEQNWIYTFNKASEIINIIKKQFSVFLKYLIDKKKSDKLDPIPEFKEESLRAKQIALDKPPYWEFHLADELLRTKLKSLRKKFDDFNNGLICRGFKQIDETTILEIKAKDLIVIISLFEKSAKKLEKSFGDPGVPGDPIEIKESVDTLINGCQYLLDWEIDLKYDIPPEGYQSYKELLQGGALEIFEQLEEFPKLLMEPFKEPNPKGEFLIYLKFRSPSKLENFNKEIH